MSACAPAPQSPPLQVTPPQDNEITILAVGDSLTEGLGLAKADAYPAQLEQVLRSKGYSVKVVNAGVSGETSAGLKARMAWLARNPADIIILCSGANDGLRGLSVVQTRENLAYTIESLKLTNATIILAGMVAPQNNGEEYTSAFNNLHSSLAKEYSLPFIPFLLDGVIGDAQLNQRDEIHPTREGYAIVIERNVLPILEPILQSR